MEITLKIKFENDKCSKKCSYFKFVGYDEFNSKCIFFNQNIGKSAYYDSSDYDRVCYLDKDTRFNRLHECQMHFEKKGKK
jgi:hypothetical protein